MGVVMTGFVAVVMGFVTGCGCGGVGGGGSGYGGCGCDCGFVWVVFFLSFFNGFCGWL